MIKYVLILFTITVPVISIYSQEGIDYHVHFFSEELLQNLRDQGYDMISDSFSVSCMNEECSNLDKIRENTTRKIAILSATYTYKAEHGNKLGLSEVDFVRRENDLLKALVLQDSNNVHAFCGIDPSKSYALGEIRRCLEELNFAGVKLHFQANQVDITSESSNNDLKAIFAYLSSKNVPVIVHLNTSDLESGTNIAHTFIDNFLNNDDNQTIIFAHSGGGGGLYRCTLDVLKVFSEFLKVNEYAKSKHIYFELSGTILDRPYPGRLESAALKAAMEEIGYDQFLFGSDYPVMKSNEYIEILREHLDLPEDVFREILTRDILTRN